MTGKNRAKGFFMTALLLSCLFSLAGASSLDSRTFKYKLVPSTQSSGTLTIYFAETEGADETDRIQDNKLTWTDADIADSPHYYLNVSGDINYSISISFSAFGNTQETQSVFYDAAAADTSGTITQKSVSVNDSADSFSLLFDNINAGEKKEFKISYSNFHPLVPDTYTSTVTVEVNPA